MSAQDDVVSPAGPIGERRKPPIRPVNWILGGILLALLGGLVAIMVPVFRAARQSSLRSSCYSSMHDIGSAISMYGDMNDDVFPVGHSDGRATGLGWAGRILPFLENPSIQNTKHFRDPSDREGSVMSYGLNANVSDVTRYARVGDPVRSVLLFEVEGAQLGGISEFKTPIRVSPVGDGASGGLRDCVTTNVEPIVREAAVNPNGETRHGKGLNMTFVDGHAKMVRTGETSGGANAPNASDAEATRGCSRPDLPEIDRPCAEGSARKSRPFTFSLR